MTAHQRKLLIVGCLAIVATLAAVLGLDWFHAHLTLASGGSAKLDIGLRTVRTCINGHCETHGIGSESGFGLFATFTLWVAVLFAIVIAVQTASRIVAGSALHQPMTTIGIMLGVMALGGLIVCGIILAPSDGLDDEGAIAIARTWSMTLLLVGVIAGFYAIYLAVADELIEHQIVLDHKPVFVARVRAPLEDKSLPPD